MSSSTSHVADVQTDADCADLSDTYGTCLEDGHECLLPVLSFSGPSALSRRTPPPLLHGSNMPRIQLLCHLQAVRRGDMSGWSCARAIPDVLCLADLVVTPGCILPLLVCNSRAHWVLEQALSAAAPYTGLIAVVRGPTIDPGCADCLSRAAQKTMEQGQGLRSVTQLCVTSCMP